MYDREEIAKALNWGGLLLLLKFDDADRRSLAESLYQTKVKTYEASIRREAERMGFEVKPSDVKLDNPQAKSALRKEANKHATFIINTHNKDLEKYIEEMSKQTFPIRNRFQVAKEADAWAKERFKKRADLIARTESFTPMTLGQTDFYTQNAIDTKFIFDSNAASCKLCKGLKASNPHSITMVKRIGIPHPNCVHSWSPTVSKPSGIPGGELWLGGKRRL